MSESGSTKTVVAIVLLSIFLASSLVFGGWAYTSRADYKDNSDKKAAAAVDKAKAEQKSEDAAQYAEDAKKPNRTYKSSLTNAGVTFDYPRTWSAYVDDSNGGEPINAYFYPDIVPTLAGKTAFALRVELLNQDYSSVVTGFDNDIKSGDLKASAYLPPKMVGVASAQPGLRLDGKISQDFQGSMVVLKVRDKTLEIYTQTKDFANDFDNTILPTLTFVP